MERIEVTAETVDKLKELAQQAKEEHKTRGGSIQVNEGGTHTISMHSDGRVTTNHSGVSTAQVFRPAVEDESAGILATLRSAQNAPISRSPLPSDLVSIAGMQTTVANAMQMGLLRRDAAGNYHEVATAGKR